VAIIQENNDIKGEFLVLSVKWHLTVSYVTDGYR